MFIENSPKIHTNLLQIKFIYDKISNVIEQGGIEMDFLQNLVTFLQVFSAIIVMILVLLQEGKEDGNIVTGESNRGGTMGSSRAARLANITKWAGIAFAILTIAATSLMIINY